MSLHAITTGWGTRVVDLGRPGTRSLGVPVGGAADRASLILGNALVGNAAGVAGLEISCAGPTLQAGHDLACVLFGAPFDLGSSWQQLRANVTFTLHQNEELRIGGTPRGMRAYFCVRGGLQVPEMLGSRSGLDVLPAHAVLPCPSAQIGRRFLPPAVFASWDEDGPLRVLPGLQASWFDQAEFLGPKFTVAAASDRMGLRLEGRPFTFQAKELTSEPVCPGSVQVTRNGQCIILGVDGQTIGGYPKIAQVITADLDRLGQLRPGQELSFEQAELAEATQLWRRRQEELAVWTQRLQFSLP